MWSCNLKLNQCEGGKKETPATVLNLFVLEMAYLRNIGTCERISVRKLTNNIDRKTISK